MFIFPLKQKVTRAAPPRQEENIYRSLFWWRRIPINFTSTSLACWLRNNTNISWNFHLNQLLLSTFQNISLRNILEHIFPKKGPEHTENRGRMPNNASSKFHIYLMFLGVAKCFLFTSFHSIAEERREASFKESMEGVQGDFSSVLLLRCYIVVWTRKNRKGGKQSPIQVVSLTFFFSFVSKTTVYNFSSLPHNISLLSFPKENSLRFFFLLEASWRKGKDKVSFFVLCSK